MRAAFFSLIAPRGLRAAVRGRRRPRRCRVAVRYEAAQSGWRRQRGKPVPRWPCSVLPRPPAGRQHRRLRCRPGSAVAARPERLGGRGGFAEEPGQPGRCCGRWPRSTASTSCSTPPASPFLAARRPRRCRAGRRRAGRHRRRCARAAAHHGRLLAGAVAGRPARPGAARPRDAGGAARGGRAHHHPRHQLQGPGLALRTHRAGRGALPARARAHRLRRRTGAPLVCAAAPAQRRQARRADPGQLPERRCAPRQRRGPGHAGIDGGHPACAARGGLCHGRLAGRRRRADRRA